jgi:hypothetical protein
MIDDRVEEWRFSAAIEREINAGFSPCGTGGGRGDRLPFYLSS